MTRKNELSFDSDDDEPVEEGRIARLVPKDYDQVDPYLNWFYRPHTITFLLIAIAFLIYYAVFPTVELDFLSNVKRGLFGSSFVFLLFSMLQMRDGLFRRPHPALWRIVTGMTILYMIFLVFLLYQSADDARKLFSYIDPTLGTALPERSYAVDCRLYTPEDSESSFRNLRDTINDEFIVAHFIGWWLKTLMIRDPYLCWILSIIFELLEISLEHLLENFKECWWDHVILDVLICNGSGIFLGMVTCRLLEVKEYNWAGTLKSPASSPPGSRKTAKKTKASLLLKTKKIFVPDLDPFAWEILSSPKRLASVIFICCLVMSVELNAFFLKSSLWIPPPHYLNIFRLFLWFFMGLPCLRELYQFISDRILKKQKCKTTSNCKKLGTMAWLGCLNSGLEALVWLKFSRGAFENPAPPLIKWTWIISITVFVMWAVVFFVLKHLREKEPAGERDKANIARSKPKNL